MFGSIGAGTCPAATTHPLPFADYLLAQGEQETGGTGKLGTGGGDGDIHRVLPTSDWRLALGNWRFVTGNAPFTLPGVDSLRMGCQSGEQAAQD